MRRWILLLATTAVLTGCSTVVQGEPTPVRIDGGEAGPLTTRPREIRLDDVNPCELLTGQQRTGLGLDEDLEQASTSELPIFAGPTCTFIGFEPRNITTSIALATGNGLDALTQPGTVQDEIIRTAVAGYPAVFLRSRTFTDFCSANIDVADDQFLNIIVSDAGKNPPISYEQLCQDAAAVAESALATLEARR